MESKHPSGPPMKLGNMRRLGVRGLVVSCLNPECRHETVISVDDYADDVPVPWFGAHMVCTACGMIGTDARPNWKEEPPRESLTGKRWR
jgi:hypothetical protein